MSKIERGKKSLNGTNEITRIDFKNSPVVQNRKVFKQMDAFIEKLISVEELADALGLAPQTIRNWVAERRIPFLRVGGRTKFRKKSMEAWLEQKEFKPCL